MANEFSNHNMGKPLGSKPVIKILAMEDLKSDIKVANIKRELNLHSNANKGETSTTPKRHLVIERSVLNAPVVKQEYLESQDIGKKSQVTTTKKSATPESLSGRRMKLFLNMTPTETPEAKKRVLACERDIAELKKPVDTIRCSNCDKLYERKKHLSHLRQCEKKTQRIKFGCTSCSFTNYHLSEIETHIKTAHKK